MAAIFDAYNEEYSSLAKDINKNVAAMKTMSSDDVSLDKTKGMISALIGQAEDLIKQMEMESRSHDSATKKMLMEKVNTYKKSLKSQQAEFKAHVDRTDKASLLGGGGIDVDSKSASDRHRLLGVNDKIYAQNERILQAQRTVVETEEVGIEITEELGRNRDKLQSSRDRIREFSGIADGASNLLARMYRREWQQKAALYFIGFAVFVGLVCGIYYGTQADSSSSSSSGK